MKHFFKITLLLALFTFVISCSEDDAEVIPTTENLEFLIDDFEVNTTTETGRRSISSVSSTFCGFVEISDFDAGYSAIGPGFPVYRSAVYFQFDFNFTQSPPPPCGLVNVTYEFIINGVTQTETDVFNSCSSTINSYFTAYTQPTEWRMKIEDCDWTDFMSYR